MRLAMFQMKNEGSISDNLAKSLCAMKEAAEHGADLILFPEVMLTEFFPQYPEGNAEKYIVTRDSEVIRAFCDASRKYGIMSVPNLYYAEEPKKQFSASAAEPDGTQTEITTEKTATEKPAELKKAFDASILIGNDGTVLGAQKMVHVGEAPYFYEQDYYLPSDDGFKVFETPFGRIGIVVCFDRHYPESIRTEALRGADLVLIPTVNTKAEPSELFIWEVRVQAFQNCVSVAMCNRVGTEGDMQFSGESFVSDADGALVPMSAQGVGGKSLSTTDHRFTPEEKNAEGKNGGSAEDTNGAASEHQIFTADDSEQILYADVDPGRSKAAREQRPYLSLRRPDLYE